MNLFHVIGQTWAIDGSTMSVVYRLGGDDCVLLEPGHPADRAAIEAVLDEQHLRVRGILSTHSHHDHFGNARYFAKKYGGLPIVLPLGEAAACRSPEAMADILGFRSTYYTRSAALSPVLGPVDETIGFDQAAVESAGAVFDVIHTPGHTADCVSFRTPDGVLIVGDVLSTHDRLQRLRAPYTTNFALDLSSKRLLAETPCTFCVMAHNGVAPAKDVSAIAAENIAVLEDMIDTVRGLIERPMSIDEIIPLFCEVRGIYGPTPVHGMHARHVVGGIIGYLLDRGEIAPETQRGLTHFTKSPRSAAAQAVFFDGSETNGGT